MDEQARLQRARAIHVAIADILCRDWDPIDIGDEPETHDEYDTYVGGIYRLLASGASPERVAEHLSSVERESMGLDPSRSQDLLAVAHKLCGLNVRLESE